MWFEWQASGTDGNAATVRDRGAVVEVSVGRNAATTPTGAAGNLSMGPASATRGGVPMAATLGLDASASLAEQTALQALAADTDLQLTAQQWVTLAEVTAHFQEVRHAYEATLAVARPLAPGRFRLEVPAYGAAGDALREKLHAELRAQLGAEAAGQITEKLGTALDGYFAGFGVSVQTLDFTADGAPSDAAYEVTRTVQYWNAADGKDRLSTRRETHFPTLEDPAGNVWGPFLALVAAQASVRG